MSFTKTETVKKSIYYPELLLEIDDGVCEIEVTYTIIGIENISGGSCSAWYTVAVDGKVSLLKKLFEFQYSGSGNPIEEAESALEKSL